MVDGRTDARGETVVGRAGLCQAMNLGLPELIATTPDDYVRITDTSPATPRALERASPHAARSHETIAAHGRPTLRPQFRAGLPRHLAAFLREILRAERMTLARAAWLAEPRTACHLATSTFASAANFVVHR